MAARRRFLVALVPPPELAHQLRGLRLLVDGPRRERIPPHLTLVAPFNTTVGDLDLRRVLRGVALDTEPFEVWLGPASSFAPENPTLHLAVGSDPTPAGHPEEGPSRSDPLAALRQRLRAAPMDRPDRHAFVPHLTLRRGADAAVTDAAPAVLSGRIGPWLVDRVFLLEQVHDDRGTSWVPIAEEPFGTPVVVGRGGIELHLRTIGTDEPLIAADRGAEPQAGDPADPGPAETVRRGEDPPDVGSHGTVPMVVVAEPAGQPGEVIAKATGALGGRAATLHALEVHEEHRGMGVARQVLARWCTDAAVRGADVAIARPDDPAALLSLGFSQVGPVVVRLLGPWRSG